MNFPTDTVNVLHHLDDMKEIFKKQDFHFTKDQQEKYDLLLQTRRERVKFFYDTNRIQRGPKVTKEEEKQEES